MAETYTSNLGLVKPDYDSPADISVINSNMDKIDNAVANAGKVKSVNDKTGDVTLTAADVGALPSDGTAANAALLNGKDASEYLLKNAKTYDVTVNSEAVGSAAITAKSVGNVLFLRGYFELVSGYAGNGVALELATVSGVRLETSMYSTIADRQKGNPFQVYLVDAGNVLSFQLTGSNIPIDAGTWINFGIIAQIKEK